MSTTTEIFKSRAVEQQKQAQYSGLLSQAQAIEQATFKALNLLISYLDGRTTKTEVVNHLTSISTPDVANVVTAIEKLDRTTKIDLAPLEQGIAALQQQLAEIPKALNSPELDRRFGSLETAIKGLRLTAEPQVNVEKPDLQPLQESLLQLLGAVKAITIPAAPAITFKALEKKLDESNTKLQLLIDKKPGNGTREVISGGGPRVPAMVVSGRDVVPVTNPDGSNIVSGLTIGDATAANQTTQITRLTSIRDQMTDGTQKSQVTNFPATQAVTGTFWQATQPVSAASLPLPSGAATGTKQDTGNTSLGSIDTKTPALGQAVAGSSSPVVLPAAQITTLTPQINALTDTQLRATAVPVSAAALPLPAGAATSANQLPNNHNVVVTSAPTTAVTGTFWQATQPVSGPLTDTQLRATAVPVSGTVTANTGLTQPLTDTQLRATAVPVSGTVATTSAAPAALVAFISTVTTGGTRVQLANNAVVAGIVQAPSTNTGIIYVGGSTVSASSYGAELQPGQSSGIAIDNTNKLYIDASVNGDKCAFFGS